ncbi:cupin domain-containing protein [Paenibacillus sp. PL2-23]|uniref:cupin domain-containing protein n=1 Tax=Paenibacillus sp. PL2-23 TaxID=2100729 RepID=UPI0030F80B57
MKVSSSNSEHYKWGASCDGWHLVKQQELSVILEHMPPGASEVRHYHKQSRQFFFVLAGIAEMELNGDIHLLEPHEGLEVPPSAPHQVKNVSSESLTFLVISHPTTRGDRYEA